MNLVRVLGIAAIIGGALRIIDSFTVGVLSPDTLSLLYFVTDVFLLLGIAGIYWSRRATLGIAGTVGAAIFALGIMGIRIAAYTMPGANGYQLGAAVALIGLGVLSADELLRRSGALAPPILWLAALIFGIAGALGLMVPLMTIAAGVAFGAGFIAAGRQVLTTPAAQ
jgi:hypothetical protein